MAKEARTINQAQVLNWFEGLAFDVQQSVLDKFSSTLEGSKQERIETLERELRALRQGSPVQKGPATKASGKASPKKGMKVPPKYMDKVTGNTWAGRGVHPTWVRDYLKKRGNKLDDLLIDKKAAK